METIVTQHGRFYAHYTKKGLVRLVFPGRPTKEIPDVIKPSCGWHLRACASTNAILQGKEPEELPPLDLSAGTYFQQQLWRMLLRIPVGEWRSYGELASKLNRPKAARAIGQACGSNPIPVIIPCHRVLSSGGGIGGFSGGLGWKRKLLRLEGHDF